MSSATVYRIRKGITKKKNFLTKNFLAALALSLGILISAGLSAVSADGTVPYTGQGSTNGVPSTTQCSGDTATPGSILWVFTAAGADSATITINGVTSNMTQSGNGTFKFVSGWYDLSTVVASATYVGTVSGNPQLTVSHGCPPGTAKVTLTKTYEQGVFTQATSGACFTLSPTAGTSTNPQCSNTPEWDGLPVGDYTITETTTPAGYATISPITFIVRSNCTGLTNCVQTGNTTAASLGTFQDSLLLGALQVAKLLGPAPGTAWNGPTVTFYVCANNPISSSTELTPSQCNSTTALQTLTIPPSPASSAALPEGYYTVCEAVLSGYTVNDQCQVAAVHAGSVATDNTLTFINTPILYWCSPGFWATAIQFNRFNVSTYIATHGSNPTFSINNLYSSIPANLRAPLKKGSPSNPTLAQVLASPSVYGGPAFNSVADYFASLLGWGGTQLTGENCPLDAHGNLTTVL